MTTTAHLLKSGATRSRVRANLDAGRWQRLGRAIVLHTGPLTRDERWHAALINVGPRSVLTAFTAAEFAGLNGWERPCIHVLAPYGAKCRTVPDLAVTLHRCGAWPVGTWQRYRCESPAPAVVRAAATLGARPACGLLAASVQQRIVTPAQLRRALDQSIRTRHRVTLTRAVADIEGGSQALSEIDFVRLCRRGALPLPDQQKLRRDSSGRRRYLDAMWRRSDGRLIVVEVDGALHLNVRRWWDDQLRQNELALAGAVVLRFPSVIVREQPKLVAQQLREALRV